MSEHPHEAFKQSQSITVRPMIKSDVAKIQEFDDRFPNFDELWREFMNEKIILVAEAGEGVVGYLEYVRKGRTAYAGPFLTRPNHSHALIDMMIGMVEGKIIADLRNKMQTITLIILDNVQAIPDEILSPSQRDALEARVAFQRIMNPSDNSGPVAPRPIDHILTAVSPENPYIPILEELGFKDADKQDIAGARIMHYASDAANLDK